MALAPERLSRFLTFLLRHKPKDYPLAIDSEGFAPWRDVVDLVQQRFYAGLSLEETAALLGVSVKTVQRDWIAARAWLRKEVARDLGD